MTQSTKVILRFGRGTVLAAAIVAMSGVLEVAGLCSALGGIVQNLGAAQSEARRLRDKVARASAGAVAGLVGIEGGVVSGVINLESSGVEAPDWRPRHDEHYHEA
jgi:hypothetical protein